MSYGSQTRNPHEHDDSPVEDDLSPCGCGEPTCLIDGNDASNVLVRGKWYAEGCAAKLPAVQDYLEADRIADERDDFNERRR
jgi:hypothetical protein